MDTSRVFYNGTREHKMMHRRCRLVNSHALINIQNATMTLRQGKVVKRRGTTATCRLISNLKCQPVQYQMFLPGFVHSAYLKS